LSQKNCNADEQHRGSIGNTPVDTTPIRPGKSRIASELTGLRPLPKLGLAHD
jgi:hypothetical protein